LTITLHMILDELGREYEILDAPQANPSFESAELLAPRGSDLSGRKLLVSALSDAMAAADNQEGLYFLCADDRAAGESGARDGSREEAPEAGCVAEAAPDTGGADLAETAPGGRGGIIILVKGSVDLTELFNEVQRIFVKINSWVIGMQRSVMENEGVQALITMSESIIGNPITVMDPTFKLLAHTMNIETDDEVTNALIRHGYHPDETVKLFFLFRRFEQFEQEGGIVVTEDNVTSKYVTVRKVFHYRDTYSILAVMICSEKPVSEGLLDLFNLLVGYLQIYVARHYPPEDESISMKALISDILEQKSMTEDEIRSRAPYAGLALHANYDMFLISFDGEINIPLGRLVQLLSDRVSGSCALSYEGDILMLNRYDGALGPDREKRLAYVDDVLEDLAANCGVSNSFTTLRDIPAAYEQAGDAIRLGILLRKRSEVYTEIPDRGLRYYYEDYALFSQALLCLTQPLDGSQHTFSFRAIQTLEYEEKKHNVPYLRILHTYLQNERRASTTCALLYMHRNTVLYHISRIEEALGVTLDDPEVRLKLLTGFKIRELMRSIP